MVKLEILIMRKIIIVFLLSSISVNAQLDSNPFVSSTKKITENSLNNSKWINYPTSISSSTYWVFDLKSEEITDYSQFSNGQYPESDRFNKITGAT